MLPARCSAKGTAATEQAAASREVPSRLAQPRQGSGSAGSLQEDGEPQGTERSVPTPSLDAN